MNISAGNPPTTYMALGLVMTFLICLTLWREMATTRTIRFFPRSFSILAFLAGRIIIIVFGARMVTDHMFPPLLFSILNFINLFLVARHMPGLNEEVYRVNSDSETSDEIDSSRRTFHFQTAMFGFVGALTFVILPQASDVAFTLAGLINVAIIGATVRVVVELYKVAGKAQRTLRVIQLSTVAFLTGSWLLIVGASFFAGTSALSMIQGARVADIVALIAVLLALQSNYLIAGFYHKTRADKKDEEAEAAKAELSQLSRVASDIYEDSNSMIQRQQGHSRDMMKRIDSLEKILKIGIEMQRHHELKGLLNMVTELIRDHLGFNTVILRLLNDRTQSFETKAHVGVNSDASDAIMNHRIPKSEFEQMIDPRYQIGRSYFINRPVPINEFGAGQDTVLVAEQWREIERVIVPLVEDDDSSPIGYISVEDPRDADLSIVEAIDNLDDIANLAVIAIRNASYYHEVREKNQKLKLYAEKLAGLNKMKSNFVATISHEFRTPLTSIKAYCETLLKNADNVDRNILKEFLLVIDEESNRLMVLIEDILDFSQMESGAVKFERTPCDMSAIVADISADMQPVFARKNITLHTRISENHPMVRAERELMKQLLTNLMQNAAKFTPENGNVWLRLEDDAVSARLIVEDDGIGIPDDQVAQVFDHFHQADNTSTREHGGTGIGLAICKNIVDWHDGKIWVENVPDRGARFVVVIPKKQVVVRSHVLDLDGTMRRYEVERYLELLIEMVAELMNVKKASLMLVDEDQEELRIESAIGMDEETVEHARVKIGEGIAGKVAAENRPYLVDDIDQDQRTTMRNNDYLYDSKSFLSVPITADGRVIGVINVSNPAGSEKFDRNDCRLLEVFTERIAIALEKMRTFTTHSSEFEDVRTTLKSMLDAKRYVDDQSINILTDIVGDIGGELGMDDKERATLMYVFNVYDLGLAKIGYNIVKQPRALTPEDRKSIEQHTILGTELIKSLDDEPSVRDAVLYHHENFDGTGYPGKLSGEEIPIAARVIRVVDTFRALTSRRPYQKQYTLGEALEVLRHRSGSFFDPRILDIFVDVIHRHSDRLEKDRADEQLIESVAYQETLS